MMRTFPSARWIAAGALCAAACGGPTEPAESAPWPVSEPEAQGLGAIAVEAAIDHIRSAVPNVNGIAVVRHGHLVVERYFNRTNRGTAHLVRSVTKSVLSAVVGVGLANSWLDSLDQPLIELLPEYFTGAEDPRSHQVALRHLLTMSSGYTFDTEGEVTPTTHWAREMVQGPMWSAPGSFRYDSSNPHLASAALTARTGFSAAILAAETLFEPLGIAEPRWDADPQGISNGSTGLYLTVLDMAKIGYLYLEDGIWNGERLLPEGWVATSTAKTVDMDGGWGYAYWWWTAENMGAPAYFAAGYRGQYIVVLPTLDMVVAIATESLRPREPIVDPLHIVRNYLIPGAR